MSGSRKHFPCYLYSWSKAGIHWQNLPFAKNVKNACNVQNLNPKTISTANMIIAQIMTLKKKKKSQK